MACCRSATSKGGQLAAGDDRPGSSDPLVDFTVPAGVNKLQIALKDLHGRGGSDFVYRIASRDRSRPDFALSLADRPDHRPRRRHAGRARAGDADQLQRPDRAVARRPAGRAAACTATSFRPARRSAS